LLTTCRTWSSVRAAAGAGPRRARAVVLPSPEDGRSVVAQSTTMTASSSSWTLRVAPAPPRAARSSGVCARAAQVVRGAWLSVCGDHAARARAPCRPSSPERRLPRSSRAAACARASTMSWGSWCDRRGVAPAFSPPVLTAHCCAPRPTGQGAALQLPRLGYLRHPRRVSAAGSAPVAAAGRGRPTARCRYRGFYEPRYRPWMKLHPEQLRQQVRRS
jgi:hypothetical protein